MLLQRTHLWEVALAVADEQASLAAASITDNDDLLGVGGRLGYMGGGRLATRRRTHGADGALAGTSALLSSGSFLVVVGIAILI